MTNKDGHRYAYGVKEMAEYYGVSPSTISVLNSKNFFKGAYFYIGRKIIYDIDKFEEIQQKKYSK